MPDLYFATGQICAVLASVMGDGKRPVSPCDFVPYLAALRPRQTPADHAAMFRALAESRGEAKPKGVL
jgi:hypothetical protein